MKAATMPMILKNSNSRLAFQYGQRSAHRSTSELVDQLQDQLKAERSQYAFKLVEKQRKLTAALRDLAELRYEMAQRDTLDAFAKTPSPSTSLH